MSANRNRTELIESLREVVTVSKLKNELRSSPTPIVDPTESENQKPVSSENVPEILNLETRFAERVSMFSQAYETYEQHKKEWLKEHSGEYVVISASDVAGFFPSLVQAYNAGRRRYGVGVFFLVLPINASDQLEAAYEFGGVKASSFKVRLNG